MEIPKAALMEQALSRGQLECYAPLLREKNASSPKVKGWRK